MKKRNEWKRRILALLLVGCMLLDSNMVVLAEETREIVTNLYDTYQTEQSYKKQYKETMEQVQPEQTAENTDVLKNEAEEKVPMDTDVQEDDATNAKEAVSLRLPETTQFTDEKEAEMTGLYGEPVEIKEHEKIYQVDATHYVTLLTSEANTYETTSGEVRLVDLTLIPKDAQSEE